MNKFKLLLSKIYRFFFPLELVDVYKRMGVNLDSNPSAKSSISRTSLSTDENDEMQLRRNNSFLHDNVD